MLLELLTGLQPVLPGRPPTTLVDHMLPHLHDLDALQVCAWPAIKYVLSNTAGLAAAQACHRHMKHLLPVLLLTERNVHNISLRGMVPEPQLLHDLSAYQAEQAVMPVHECPGQARQQVLAACLSTL